LTTDIVATALLTLLMEAWRRKSRMSFWNENGVWKRIGETIAPGKQTRKEKDVIYFGIVCFSTVFISTLSFAFREYEYVS